jgi:AcrR family transcriptional regulator
MTTPRNAPRLSRDDWLAAGMEVLAARGGEALKAEPLARYLNTTKGSFYWHFRDVPTFHAALLARWEDTAAAETARVLSGEDTPVKRLRALAQALADPGGTVGTAEAAIRAWGIGTPAPRDALARVDAARLAQLRALLSEAGIGNPEMARILHAAATGMALTGPPAGAARRDAIGSLVDLILALR